jgi:signal transduction histidine kinase/CheY-like chemotaxis protein
MGTAGKRPELSRLFADLAEVVEPTLDLRAVARRAYKLLVEGLAVDQAGIYLVWPDGRLHVAHGSLLADLRPEERSVPASDPLVARLREEGRPLRRPVDEHPNPPARRLLAALGVTGILFTPLTAGKRFLGFFACSRSGDPDLADLSDELAHALGRIVGIAFEQARLLAEGRARVDADRALLDAARLVSSGSPAEAILPKYAEALARAAGAPCAGIGLPDPAGSSRLRVAALCGMTPEDTAELLAVPFSFDSPVVAEACTAPRLLRFEAPRATHDAVKRIFARNGYTHFFLLPLVASGVTHGIAFLTGVPSIEPDLQIVVEAVGHEIALAIEATQERDAARRHAERETLEEELRRAALASFDLDPILQGAVDKLGRALGAARCYAGLTAPGQPGRVTNEWRNPPSLPSALEWQLAGADRPIARAARAANEVVCGDVLTDPRFGSIEANAPGDLRAFILVNFLQGEFSKGWIVVAETDRGRRWQDEEVRLVRAVAEHCGLAVRRAELHEDAQRRAMELELTISHMTDSVVMCNERLEVVRANDAARQLVWGEPIRLGPAPTEERRRVTVHELDGRELAADELPIVRAVRSGEVVRDRELLLRLSPDGQQRIVVSSASPLRAVSGQLVGGVVVMKDVTEARAAAANASRTEKLRVVGELAASVAHDINNTLASVLGSAEVIAGTSDQAEVRRNADVIAQGARDASVILGRLTRLSQRTRASAPRDAIDLAQVAADAIELTRPRWSRPGQAIATKLEAPGPVPVRGVATELREVLTNLILNAVDALPSGGRIAIRVAASAGEAVLEVQDDGAGMSDEVLRHAFEPFYTTKGDAGTGLGLSISSAIVAAHGGRMETESMPGHGTRIRVLVPLAGDALPALRAPLAARHVLVVDDDARVRSLLVDFVAAGGHRVVPASSGEEALRHLGSDGGGFDLLVTDYLMPGMSGLALVHEARVRRPGLPVVIVSGFLGDAESVELERLGARVLTKPFGAEDVSAAVAAALAPGLTPGQ